MSGIRTYIGAGREHNFDGAVRSSPETLSNDLVHIPRGFPLSEDLSPDYH
ncbi:MAG: hypothetical protein U1G08_21385 [Verrucomicrobiota bacterium]